MIPPVLLIVNVQKPQNRLYLPLPLILLWPLLIPVHLVISAITGVYVGLHCHTQRLIRGTEVCLRILVFPSHLRGMHLVFRQNRRSYTVTII